MNSIKTLKLPGLTFVFTFLLLSAIQIKPGTPLLLLERFLPNGGWIEIVILSVYAAVLVQKLFDVQNVEKWRRISWLLFSVVFFSQFVLGVFVNVTFLMTGKLHIPVPALILSGSIYRMQISFMPILFLSTILLSGPAWCSHLCYFGALDNFAASLPRNRKIKLTNKKTWKHTLLLIVVLITVVFRNIGVSQIFAATAAITFGIIGLIIILLWSRNNNKMVHCTLYCPIGTIVNYLKYISPFRLKIDHSCTNCMVCIPSCRYDALTPKDITNKKPGITCTLCGECLSSCKTNSFRYSFFKLEGDIARKIYLAVSVCLHAAFLGVARI